jgi:hypothetical protein
MNNEQTIFELQGKFKDYYNLLKKYAEKNNAHIEMFCDFYDMVIKSYEQITGLFHEITKIEGNWKRKDKILPKLLEELNEIFNQIKNFIPNYSLRGGNFYEFEEELYQERVSFSPHFNYDGQQYYQRLWRQLLRGFSLYRTILCQLQEKLNIDKIGTIKRRKYYEYDNDDIEHKEPERIQPSNLYSHSTLSYLKRRYEIRLTNIIIELVQTIQELGHYLVSYIVQYKFRRNLDIFGKPGSYSRSELEQLLFYENSRNKEIDFGEWKIYEKELDFLVHTHYMTTDYLLQNGLQPIIAAKDLYHMRKLLENNNTSIEKELIRIGDLFFIIPKETDYLSYLKENFGEWNNIKKSVIGEPY